MPDGGLQAGRKRVRRTTTQAQPWGLLLPLVGLLLTLAGGAAVAKWQIEAVALDTARDALREAGLAWVEVEVSGQRVSLAGVAPSANAGRDAEAIVLASKAGTWVGALAPVTRATSAFTSPPACEPVEVPEPPARDWSFRLLAGKLTLAGVLPDEATKGAVLEAARAKVAPPRVVSVEDELKVSGLPATEAERATALRGISTVGRCDSGEAAFRAGVFSLRCEIARAVEPSVREEASAPLLEGTIGEIALLVSEEIASCEGALAEILQRSTIEFATGSAEIQQASQALLDEVAAEAKKCPGTLRVEGHTDSRGEPAFNLSLSEERAESVRAALVERGLAGERLLSVGFGDTKPKDSNTTEEGRSHNRRIEIKVVRSHE